MKNLLILIFAAASVCSQAQTLVKRIPGTNQPAPLYVIDGVKIVSQADELPLVDPENIEKIQVLKGKDATDPYGSEGEHGVIVITTKRGLQKKSYSSQKQNTSNTPLYILDGVKLVNDTQTTSETLSKIDPRDIISINVMKGDSAFTTYGESGKNGVVLINTRKGHPRKSE